MVGLLLAVDELDVQSSTRIIEQETAAQAQPVHGRDLDDQQHELLKDTVDVLVEGKGVPLQLEHIAEDTMLDAKLNLHLELRWEPPPPILTETDRQTR